MMTRREFLAAAAATSWAFCARADTARLRKETLPDPDFSRLRAKNPYVIGVRPHRKGGIRLELERAAGKHLVHNYGHGGAGITLSWGCAAVATDLVQQAMATLGAAPSIAVIGTGVIGLTTATELRRRFPKSAVTVYAKNLDVRTTTSFIAGGQFEPSGIFHEYESPERKQLFATYLRRARDRVVALEKSPDARLFGVAVRKDYTLDHENRGLDEFTPPDVIAPYRRGTLPFQRLNGVGREYTTWLMNPMILLPKLVADLRATGVTLIQREFASLADLTALEQPIIVNCTGYGAKAMLGDASVVPQRGHLVVLEKPSERHDYFFSGGCANPVIEYVFCRQSDIVLGGTVISGDDSTAHAPADAHVFQRLLSNTKELFGGHPDMCRR